MLFPHLLGNERLKQTFASVSPEKIGSAVIFDGPSGCGKVTAARDLAAALLCTGRDRPCGVCPSCRRMEAGSHSDFELFGYSKEVPKLDDVRAMRSRSFVQSGESGLKVFVIADADRLNVQSQNALLKVLEEPANSVFILTCENYLGLLQTVRSRCTVFHVEPLPPDILRAQLAGKCSPEDAERVIPLCEGRLEYALELLSGSESAARQAVRTFFSALGSEKELFRASVAAAALSRDDYSLFCTLLSDEIAKAIPSSDDADKLIKIYDYLSCQLKLMPQNPSVTALSGALTAFCGEIYGG